uniref:Uncharacterized protein n=1 Tax=Cacopsylla melanoneura TaxID=428564 RepID=A0A8D9F4R6_9HEMI
MYDFYEILLAILYVRIVWLEKVMLRLYPWQQQCRSNKFCCERTAHEIPYFLVNNTHKKRNRRNALSRSINTKIACKVKAKPKEASSRSINTKIPCKVKAKPKERLKSQHKHK